jgi:hypothetical protein
MSTLERFGIVQTPRHPGRDKCEATGSAVQSGMMIRGQSWAVCDYQPPAGRTRVSLPTAIQRRLHQLCIGQQSLKYDILPFDTFKSLTRRSFTQLRHPLSIRSYPAVSNAWSGCRSFSEYERYPYQSYRLSLTGEHVTVRVVMSATIRPARCSRRKL